MRLVTDLKPVKKIVDKVGYPFDGSSHILRRLDPEETYFAVVDFVQGSLQIPLQPDSRDLMSIILPQGKYRFTCLPQGCSVSTDFFNIFTDPQIRGKVGYCSA